MCVLVLKMDKGHIAAIILSAGLSSRMKGFKPLLPFGNLCVLETVIRMFRSSGINDIYVVTGHRHNDIKNQIDSQDICLVKNEAYKQGMFSSVITGIKCLDENHDAFFIMPVDFPMVRKETILELIASYNEKKGLIFYPAFEGLKGHPPLISAKLILKMMKWKGQTGLRGFLSQFQDEAVNVNVADKFILRDIDTEKEYRQMLNELNIL